MFFKCPSKVPKENSLRLLVKSQGVHKNFLRTPSKVPNY